MFNIYIAEQDKSPFTTKKGTFNIYMAVQDKRPFTTKIRYV